MPDFFLEDESRHVIGMSPVEFFRLFPECTGPNAVPLTRELLLERIPLSALPSWFVAKELYKEDVPCR